MIEGGKKYNERTIYGMRTFYEVFSDENWTHWVQNWAGVII